MSDVFAGSIFSPVSGLLGGLLGGGESATPTTPNEQSNSFIDSKQLGVNFGDFVTGGGSLNKTTPSTSGAIGGNITNNDPTMTILFGLGVGALVYLAVTK